MNQIMRYTLLIVAIGVFLALVTGCAGDGWVRVYWKEHESPIELQRDCGRGLIGCAMRAGDACMIHTHKMDRQLLDTLGHELKHCFRGKWH